MKLWRYAPGLYFSTCGRYSVQENTWPTGEKVWYWQEGDREVHDHYERKWQTVEALEDYIKNRHLYDAEPELSLAWGKKRLRQLGES